MLQWHIRVVQRASRDLNERITRVVHAIHVSFVRVTEIQEQVRRTELTDAEANPQISAELYSIASMIKQQEMLLKERDKLLTDALGEKWLALFKLAMEQATEEKSGETKTAR